MTSTVGNAPLRLTSPSDIVEAVPFLVGFQPEDSLVVLSLRGVRSRIGVTARVDLPPPAYADQCARDLTAVLKRDRATKAILVAYPPSGGVLHDSVAPAAEAMFERLTRARIEVCDVLCVYDGLWWSMHCTDDRCCPPEGTPVLRAGTSACAVAMTVHGRSVLGSRDELARTLDPVGGVARSAMAHALPLARAELVERERRFSRAELVAESVGLFAGAIHGWGSAGGASSASGQSPRSIDNLARLIAGLDDVLARDQILGWSVGERADALRALLVELARHAVAPHQVAAMTTLACAAYLQGDGAIAGIAVDRALDADPEYRLAVLLDQALTGGLDPNLFKPVMGRWR